MFFLVMFVVLFIDVFVVFSLIDEEVLVDLRLVLVCFGDVVLFGFLFLFVFLFSDLLLLGLIF